MINNKATKFKIEFICRSSAREDISYIYDQITIFMDTITHLIDGADISTKIINDDIIPKYTGNYDHHEEKEEEIPSSNEISTGINDFKKKFYNDKDFNNHIESLPNYVPKRPLKSMKYVEDFLIKNKSAKLRDIKKGCKDEGLEASPSAIYSTLKKLMAKNKISKEGKAYIWNYDSED